MNTYLPWLLVGILTVLLLVAAQDRPSSPAGANQPATQPATAPASGAMQGFGERIIRALEETPGCLGTKTVRLPDGQSSIFGFFEDKQAAMRWYEHPVHVRLRGGMAGKGDVPAERAPMAHVPEGVPVLAVASIGFDGPPAMPESPIPFHSIAIELYVPVNGGLRINDGFAPQKFAELMDKRLLQGDRQP